jgi:hypothetical protein
VGEHAHLACRQQAVGHGDAQHVGMALHVQAVLQAQRQELFFGQLIGEAALHLVAVLRDALADDEVVVLVVTVHGRILGGGPVLTQTMPNINKMELYSKLLRIYLLI